MRLVTLSTTYPPLPFPSLNMTLTHHILLSSLYKHPLQSTHRLHQATHTHSLTHPLPRILSLPTSLSHSLVQYSSSSISHVGHPSLLHPSQQVSSGNNMPGHSYWGRVQIATILQFATKLSAATRQEPDHCPYARLWCPAAILLCVPEEDGEKEIDTRRGRRNRKKEEQEDWEGGAAGWTEVLGERTDRD